MRRVLFRYLARPESIPPLKTYFERASEDLIQALGSTQPLEPDRQSPLYETAILKLIRENLISELRFLPEGDPEALERFIRGRRAGAKDIPAAKNASSRIGSAGGETGAVRTSPFQPSFLKNAAPAPAQKSPAAEETAPPDPAALAQAQARLELYLTLLRHYARSQRGEPVKDQLPMQIVMMSNPIVSMLLSANSPRRDIRVLQDELIPQSTTFQTLFLYFLSEAGNPTLRGGFNYFLVCGNRESDYTYCRMRYTKKDPGSIVVDCRIHNKNVERSFKKFRWLPAQPTADALDLSVLRNLYDVEEDGEDPVEEENWEEFSFQRAGELEKPSAPQKESGSEEFVLDFF